MVDAEVFRWANGSFVEDDWCDPHAGPVIAADSWLVVDGAAVAVRRHLERFAGSLAQRGIPVDSITFGRDVLERIPREGRWFPRIDAVEFADSALLRLHLRPAPEPLTEVTLGTSVRDPRTQPLVKGPDLVALGALRNDVGAGEAVILTDGFVAEGAWSTIVWWANDTFHIVDYDIPRLPSVTERILLEHARYIGAPVVPARVTPADLEGTEVWILSALHGIRVATEWVGGPVLSIEAGRADYWRQQYVNQRQVISQV